MKTDARLRDLTDHENARLLNSLRQTPGYEEWMWPHISAIKVEYHDGWTGSRIIHCWHPDQTIFYSSSVLEDCVQAFTKYPYKG